MQRGLERVSRSIAQNPRVQSYDSLSRIIDQLERQRKSENPSVVHGVSRRQSILQLYIDCYRIIQLFRSIVLYHSTRIYTWSINYDVLSVKIQFFIQSTWDYRWHSCAIAEMNEEISNLLFKFLNNVNISFLIVQLELYIIPFSSYASFTFVML